MKKIILLLLIICVGSCSLAARGSKPEVSLVDVQFSDVSLFETSADFTIRLQNENPFPLEFDGASHNIYLNGINIGKGLSDERLVVPRLGSATQRVKVRVSNISLVRNISELIDAKSFDYRIDSVLYLPGSFGISRYTVSQEGRFNKF